MNKQINDKYYTKTELAIDIIREVNNLFSDYEFDYLDVGAGSGVFMNLGKAFGMKIKGIDIEPDNEDIISCDFLDEFNEPLENTIVISNPPYGRACSSAISFFNKSAELNAKAICLLVPSSFGHRLTLRKRLNNQYSLYSNNSIGVTEFYRKDNQDRHNGKLSVCFQVWVREPRDDTLIVNPSDYKIVKPKSVKYYSDNIKKEKPVGCLDVDFTVITHGAKLGTVQDFNPNVDKVTVKQFVKVFDKNKIEEVKSKFRQADYSYIKEATALTGTGQYSISTEELYACAENIDISLKELKYLDNDLENYLK